MVFGRDGTGAGGSLIQLPSGQLYYRNPMDPRHSRTLVFKEATATIVRASSSSQTAQGTASFQYQLIVSRVYEEGERELQDELDEDEEDQKSFLLDVLLKPRRELTTAEDEGDEPKPCFIWFDVCHASGICSWEFVADPSVTNTATLDAFEETMYRCMFERKYHKAPSQVSNGELQAFVKGLKAMSSGGTVSSVDTV